MAITRYEPWHFVAQLQDDINRLFSDMKTTESSAATAEWVPLVDIEEFGNRFEILVDLPGVSADAVEITLDNGVLTLSGERPRLKGADEKDEPVRQRAERGHGRFYRRFILPDTANAEGVKAKGRDGVLQISIPKQEKAQPRRITVKS